MPIETRTAARVDYAGWWQRFGAWLIDWMIVGSLWIAVAALPEESVPYLVGVVAMYVLVFAYFALLNGHGQTLGKRLFRITVVDEETGEPIGFGRGAGREAMRLVLVFLIWVPFFIDGLRPLWNERRQSWHDPVVSSIVVCKGRRL